MGGTFSDRLGAARRAQVIGRDAELARLDALAVDGRRRVAYVHGPAGSGKTLLLREWLRTQAESGAARIAILDAQVDVSRPGAIEAIADGATVIAIDDFHRLAPLETWFYDVFLPSLDEQVRVAVTSRRPPRREELLDPAWRDLIEVIDLRPLTDEESRTYLESRGVPSSAHDRILSFARGIPLWLCVAADVALAHPERRFDASHGVAKVEPLVKELLDDAPGPLHRRALVVAAVVSEVTESILEHALDVSIEDAATVFAWLCARPYVQRAGEGVRLHDALREAVRRDLEWRDPDVARATVDRSFAAMLASIWSSSGDVQERRVVQLGAALANEPGGLACGGPGGEDHYSDRVLDEEMSKVLDAITCHEGKGAAAIAKLWLEHQRDGLVGLRDSNGRLAAFILYVDVGDSVPPRLRDADPFVGAFLSYLAELAPLRPGETPLIARWWMALDTYQRPEPMQLRLFAHMGWRLAFVGAAVAGAVNADPDLWLRRPDRVHELMGTFDLDGRPYGVFGTDWRRMSRERWVEKLVETFRTLPPVPSQGPPSEFVILARETFGAAVRAALRGCPRRDRLVDNMLLGTRLVAKRAPVGSRQAERIDALIDLLVSGVDALASQPGTKRHATTLERTFFHPETAKGVVVADDLGLPYGSYRRILNEAVELLVEELWRRETERA